MKQASFVGIAAVGMTFVLLTGGIDLSVGATMYLAPLIAGTMMRDHGLGVGPALLVALGMGFIIGAVNGFFVVKLKIVPFIVTLSTLFFMRGAGTFLTDSRQLDFPREMVDFGLWDVLGVPLPILCFVLVVLLGHLILTQTRFGRQLYAVGNDLEAAKKAGINTDRVIWSVYIINGVLAALAGFILIAQIGRLDQAFGEGMEFDVVAAAVLGGASLFGGVGRAYGPMIGAVLIQMVRAGLIYTDVNLYLQPMAQAAIIFLAVFFDSLRETGIRKLKRRFIRVEA
ncbi:MAG: ABC transporter permease [Anaerolineae bacterium]|nr:ABC transporter permease [Anaerolineae bacterium]